MHYSYWIGHFYFWSIIIIDVIYIAVFLGIFVNIPVYIRSLSFIIQSLLCVILMIRFHPFKENNQLKPNDTMFIFGAATFLFTNVVLVEMVKFPIVNMYLNKTLSFLHLEQKNLLPNSNLHLPESV
jgi:intracellular septation protein A